MCQRGPWHGLLCRSEASWLLSQLQCFLGVSGGDSLESSVLLWKEQRHSEARYFLCWLNYPTPKPGKGVEFGGKRKLIPE